MCRLSGKFTANGRAPRVAGSHVAASPELAPGERHSASSDLALARMLALVPSLLQNLSSSWPKVPVRAVYFHRNSRRSKILTLGIYLIQVTRAHGKSPDRM